MSRNYSNYSKSSKTFDKPVIEPVVKEVREEEDVTVENLTEAIEKVSVEPSTPAPTHGFVSGCKKLRVRSSADSNSKINILCEIAEKEKVEIVDTLANWYKIRTKADVEGFCMSKYITLIQ